MVRNSPCLARRQAAYRNGEASFKVAALENPAELSPSPTPLWLSLQTLCAAVVTVTAQVAAATVTVVGSLWLKGHRDSREKLMAQDESFTGPHISAFFIALFCPSQGSDRQTARPLLSNDSYKLFFSPIKNIGRYFKNIWGVGEREDSAGKCSPHVLVGFLST